MAVKIGHSSKDEYGRFTGGVAGDQTGKEVCIRSWYNGGWNLLARPISAAAAEKIAKTCEDGCANPLIGYDQGQRNTLRSEAKKTGYDLTKIDTACESDCSSFVGVCVEAAGIALPSGNGPTTRTLRNVLKNTGAFEILTESKYLTTDKYLRRGDILVKEGSHTVMVLENGTSGAAVKVDAPTVYYSVRLPKLVKGSSGAAVKNLQHLLLAHGEKLPKYGADADFGDETGDALEAFQIKNGLAGDRVCEPATWAALIMK